MAGELLEHIVLGLELSWHSSTPSIIKMKPLIEIEMVLRVGEECRLGVCVCVHARVRVQKTSSSE